MLSIFKDHIVVVVQWLSRVQLFATPRTAARQASLSITISQSLVKLMSIESVMPSNHLILCHPLLFTSALILCISWKKLQSLEVLICNLLIHFPKMLYLIFSLIQILLRKKNVFSCLWWLDCFIYTASPILLFKTIVRE